MLTKYLPRQHFWMHQEHGWQVQSISDQSWLLCVALKLLPHQSKEESWDQVFPFLLPRKSFHPVMGWSNLKTVKKIQKVFAREGKKQLASTLPDNPRMSALLSSTAWIILSQGTITPRSITLKLLQPRTTPTMFLPMSWTSPLTVAKTITPLYLKCSIYLELRIFKWANNPILTLTFLDGFKTEGRISHLSENNTISKFNTQSVLSSI